MKQAKAPTCHYHGERRIKAVLRSSTVIYGGRDYGLIWMCPETDCGAYVGVHKGTEQPKGTLANFETREARKRAHAALDPLWKGGAMKRSDAYAALADFMGVERRRCHIGYMNPDECAKVVAFVAARETPSTGD